MQATIELRIARRRGQTLALLTLVRAGKRLVLAEDAVIALDRALLAAHAQDSAAYGAALKAMVFSQQMEAAWLRGVDITDGEFDLHLHFPTTIDGQSIDWKALQYPRHLPDLPPSTPMINFGTNTQIKTISTGAVVNGDLFVVYFPEPA